MFHSTRSKKRVSGCDAIIKGLADDGGLYVMDIVPTVNYKEFFLYTYQEMAAKILHLFFSEFNYVDILREVNDAYMSFDIDDVVRLEDFDKMSVLELFHGPTAAFKDLALVVLPRMLRLAKIMKEITHTTTILAATSGDTGGATLSGFKNIEGIEVIVLYPDQGVSPLQEAQMQSFHCDNGHVIPVKGNFDECQSFVKEFFITNKDLHLSSANSINISRLIPQIVYYFYSYIDLVKKGKIKEDDLVNFIVPTGNFGDILAGYIAKKMGLPVGKLVCASNENNVLTEFFATNCYNAKRSFYQTNSPSMDIVISSNLERLLYFETKSVSKVKGYMKDLKEKKEFKMRHTFKDFKAYDINQTQTLEIIKKYYKEKGYLVDPHTAVALGAYDDFKKINDDYSVVIATASPFKFANTVLKALEQETDTVNDLANYLNVSLPNKFKYPPFTKEAVSLTDLDSLIKEEIACFKSK